MLGRPHYKNVRKKLATSLVVWRQLWSIWTARTCRWRSWDWVLCRGSPPNSQNSRSYVCFFQYFRERKKWTKHDLHFSLTSSFFSGHFCSEEPPGEPSQPHPVSCCCVSRQVGRTGGRQSALGRGDTPEQACGATPTPHAPRGDGALGLAQLH